MCGPPDAGSSGDRTRFAAPWGGQLDPPLSGRAPIAVTLRRQDGRRRNLASLADPELMVMVHGRDCDAFAVLFERHVDAAYSLAYRICRRRNLAEDIAQDALLSVWRSGSSFDAARGSVRSWLLGIVHHRAIDALRRESVRAGRDTSDDEAVSLLPAPERTDAEVERHDQSDQVRGALDALPVEQRMVIDLAYFHGLTHIQIAASLQLPVGTVKGRMRLGLNKLHAALTEPTEAVS